MDDSGFDPGSGKYHDSYSKLPGSESYPISKESALLEVPLSRLRFHIPHFIILNAYCIARWGESTIFRVRAPRQMDPDVFRCAESGGSVCF